MAHGRASPSPSPALPVPMTLLVLCALLASAVALPSSLGHDSGSSSWGAAIPSLPRRARLRAFHSGRELASAPPAYLTANQILDICTDKSNPTLILRSANVTSRVWKGWGASLAWWANYLGGLNTTASNAVLDLLYHPKKGIPLNIVRYNIAGGYTRMGSPQLVNPTPSYLKYRGIPGYRTKATGPYNWAADPRQRAVLIAAQKRGANRFIAYSSSPPAYLTVSGDVAGNVKGAPNLKAGNEAAFVKYLADVVQQFATAWGVKFESLEPFNQPLTKWKKGGLQEGCAFSPEQVAQIATALKAALVAKNLTTTLAVLSEFASNTPGLGGKLPAGLLASVGQFSVHGYQSSKKADKNAADYKAAAAYLAQYKKEIYVPEWGPDSADGSDIGLALYMSRMIVESVNFLRVSAWNFWQPLDPSPKWTLISANWDANATVPLVYRRTKKYYALQQFARTIPPGSVPVDLISSSTCSYNTAAFYLPCKKQVVIVVVNQQSTSKRVSVGLQGFKKVVNTGIVQKSMYRTSTTENFLALLPARQDLKKPVTFVAAPKSLTTVVLGNLKSTIVAQTKCAVLTKK